MLDLENAMPAVHLAGVCRAASLLQEKKKEDSPLPFISMEIDLDSTCKADREIIPCTITAWGDEAVTLSHKEKDDTVEVLAMPIPVKKDSYPNEPVFQAVHVISKYTDAAHISQETYRTLYDGESEPPQLLNTIHFSARMTEKPELKNTAFGKHTLNYLSTVVDLDSDAKENDKQCIPCRIAAWSTPAVQLSHFQSGSRFSFLAEPIAMRQEERDTLAFRVCRVLESPRSNVSREAFIKLFQC